jgi:hypothetical protein
MNFGRERRREMFYGYISFTTGTEKVYVITSAHDTPDAAETARETKIKLLPRRVYLSNFFLSRGVLMSREPIEIPDGYFGTAV